jgi:uncharacterized repeat protein (TIGR02543 family)
MAKTYTLQSTSINPGWRSAWSDADWNDYSSAANLSGDLKKNWVGKVGWTTDRRATNILFDSSTLATLRTKTVTSIKLTLTVVSGTIPNANNYPIGYKLNSSATDRGSWTRSNSASTAASTSAVAGYIKSSPSIEANNTSITLDMGTTVPVYGYTTGAYSSSLSDHVILGTSATLVVTTNETDYSITLSYNANGGSGGPSAETKTGTASGTPSVAFTVSNTKPTRANASAGSYTVTYNANGGSVSPASASAARTTSYTFSKWNTNSGGSGNNYVGGNTITLSSSATLYAQWTSSTTTAAVALPTPTRTGYTFNGWYTAASGGTKIGNGGASYTPTANITIYAQWTIVKYTISYNANGGNASSVPASQTKAYNESGFKLSSTVPTRANGTTTYTVTYNANGGSVGTASATATKTTTYPFSKWNTAANGSGTNYAAGASYTANANATMYAQWTSSASTTSVTLPTPSLTGYAFNGWYTAASGGTRIGNAGASYTPTATITLYAQWTKNTYTVSYAKNTTATVSNMPSNQTKTQGVDLTLSSNVPTRSGYTFKGWATSASGSVAYAAGGKYTANAAVTLYAVWWADKATLSTVSNTTIGSTGTATWSIPDSTYTYKLVLSYTGATSVSYDIAATSEAYKTFTFTIPNSWLSALSNTTSATATATLTTSRGGTSLGSATKTFTVSVGSSVEPTISSFTATHKSSNSTVSGSGWGGTYTQGYSYARLTVSATAGEGASISSIKFSGPGINTTGTATTVDTAVFDTSGTKTFTVTVTDSRGRTKSSTVPVTVYAYSKPTISSIETYRCNDNGTLNNGSGTYMIFKPHFSVSSVNGKNSVQTKTLKWRLKGGSWNTYSGTITDNTFTSVVGSGNIGIASVYEVQLTVTDKLSSSTFTTTLPGASGIWYAQTNDRLGLGSPPEQANTIRSDWVPDIVPRRCYATLSSKGWYRAIKFSAINAYDLRGADGSIIDIYLSRIYNYTDNEAHKISLLRTYNNNKFVSENSVSKSLGIDGIRLTIHDGGSGDRYAYIDIHYSLTTENPVAVHFNVYSTKFAVGNDYTDKWFAESMQSVVEAPSGETVLTEYTLSGNTDGDTSLTAMGKTWYFRKRNGVVYIDAPDAMTPTTSGSNSIGTLPVGFRPKYPVRLRAANFEGTDYKTLVIGLDGLVQAFCYTTPNASTPFGITGSYLAT